jgi:hypothetical protein
MNLNERVEMVKRYSTFIATKFDETDEAITSALAEVVKFIGSEADSIVARRKAYDESTASYAKRNAELRAGVVATGGTVPAPINAEISTKA